MPLFTKTEKELKNRKDKWFYFLKNLDSFEHIPAILREPIFEQAFETAEYVKLQPKEQKLYEEELKIFRDNFSVMETAQLKAKAEGIAEGKIEEKIENARNFKRLGVSIATIAKATGLSVKEIKRLD
jgi:predicted transposase/invertase (TIGR01784 family)